MTVNTDIPAYDPTEGFIYSDKNVITPRPGESHEQTRARARETFENVEHAPGFKNAVLRRHENGSYVICTKAGHKDRYE